MIKGILDHKIPMLGYSKAINSEIRWRNGDLGTPTHIKCTGVYSWRGPNIFHKMLSVDEYSSQPPIKSTLWGVYQELLRFIIQLWCLLLDLISFEQDKSILGKK